MVHIWHIKLLIAKLGIDYIFGIFVTDGQLTADENVLLTLLNENSYRQNNYSSSCVTFVFFIEGKRRAFLVTWGKYQDFKLSKL